MADLTRWNCNVKGKHQARRKRIKERMKLGWSPERASKAYIDAVKSSENHGEAGVAELVSAMAAGWNAQFIMESWSKGGTMETSIGLAVACSHTEGSHLCIVPDEESCSEYIQAMNNMSFSPEVMVGEPAKVLEGVDSIEFLVVDGRRKDMDRFTEAASLNSSGSVLVCKNAGSMPVRSRLWRCWEKNRIISITVESIDKIIYRKDCS